MDNPPKKLTPKRERFCREYLIDLNATQAAIRAGYSKHTARSIANEILTIPDIQEVIQKELNIRKKRTEITADYVINNIKEINERCMQRVPVMTFNRETKEYEQETEPVTHDDGTITEEGIWSFKELGALRANELLGKHLNIFNDKGITIDNSRHTHYTTINDKNLIDQARKRKIPLPKELESREIHADSVDEKRT